MSTNSEERLFQIGFRVIISEDNPLERKQSSSAVWLWSKPEFENYLKELNQLGIHTPDIGGTPSIISPCYVVDFPVLNPSGKESFLFKKDYIGNYNEKYHPFAYESWRQARSIADFFNECYGFHPSLEKIGYAQVLAETIEFEDKEKIKILERKDELSIIEEIRQIKQKISEKTHQ